MAEHQDNDPGRWSDIAPRIQHSNSSFNSVEALRVQELPPELIAKIIHFFLEDIPNVTVLPQHTRSRHPRLQITQVCTAWRAIAFSIYDLWELAVYGNSPGSCNLANSWLRQITGPRLSLTIIADGSSDELRSGVRGKPSTPVEDLVIPHAQRLRKLSVPVTANSLRKLLHLSDNSFDNLEILHLQFVGGARLIVDTTSSPFITAPLLRELSLALDHGFQMKTHFPWAQLTTISVTGIGLDAADCLSVLSCGASLIDLSLSFISDIDSETETRISALRNHPLHLSNVKKLHLDFSCSNPGPFLLFLELPNLVHLTLGSLILVHWSRASHRQFFESFAQRLEYFETNNSYMFVELDDEILTWMPNLRSLILGRDYRLTNTTLQRIAAGALLPKVERLDFCTRDFSLVVRMLSERRRNSKSFGSSLVCIKKIKIYARTWMVDDEYWKLRAQGVEIQLARI